MTDGIIQKVCNKIIENPRIVYDVRNTAYQIREELIEEIKKYRVWQWDAVKLKDLIGDNNE